MSEIDIIDHFVGQALALRDRRPITKEQTQASYQALFEATALGDFTHEERFSVALFVAVLHRDVVAQNFYADKLKPAQVKIIINAAASALTVGPYGTYPAGPLTGENVEGQNWQADSALIDALGRKLAVAFEHTHMLVFHPRDASKNYLERLIEAGWDTPAIVSLSQLVSYLVFQLRIATGLRALSANAV